MYHKKVITDYNLLREKINAHRTLGHKIVSTLGSWDMLHIGHLRYLYKSKEYGDILVVGVDSDRGIKAYKNPLRPIIPETERMEMLSYLRGYCPHHRGCRSRYRYGREAREESGCARGGAHTHHSPRPAPGRDPPLIQGTRQ